METKEVNTWCRFCFSHCPVTLRIENNIITKVKPRDRFICPVGLSIGNIVHAPDRLVQPMKKKPCGGWQRISWEQALEIISAQLKKTANEYGPSSLSVHMGQARSNNDIQDYVRRFCNLFGTPNLSSSSSQCYCSLTAANCLTYGYLPSPDYDRTQCILVWGCNPAASDQNIYHKILEAVDRGARLIVIDPRKTPLAARADIHLAVRPGGDRALALGMLNEIIRDKLYDVKFVEEWTLGFGTLMNMIQEFPPDKVASIAGVNPEDIEHAARLFATSQPGCIVMGNALEQQLEGFQTVRAIAILQAICGSLDVPGGALINTGHNLTDISLEDHKPVIPAIGQNTYPIYYDYKKEAQGNLLMDAILAGKPYPIRSMIIAGANPMLSLPNTGKVKKALEKLDFLVVMDTFLTDTAKLADIVLPAAFFLERTDLCELLSKRPLRRRVLLQPVLQPPGEAWPDWKFWFALADHLGFQSYFPWTDYTSAAVFRTESAGIAYDQLVRDPDSIELEKLVYYKYRSKGFPTRSGKVEIYSDRLASLGYNPLPTDPLNRNDNDILTISAGERVSGYILSRFRNIPSLRHRLPEPLAEISLATAERYQLHDGQTIILRTPNGEIQVKVTIKDVAPGTLFMSHGWTDANPNLLTDDACLDPISGFPVFRTLLCEVEKA